MKVPPESEGKARNVQVGIKDIGMQNQKEIVSYYDKELIFNNIYDGRGRPLRSSLYAHRGFSYTTIL